MKQYLHQRLCQDKVLHGNSFSLSLSLSYFTNAYFSIRLGAPVVGALCCLGLILFLIAATIVLSLIPVYLATRNIAKASKTETLLLPVPAGTSFPVGPLNSAQIAILQQNVSFL
jgi:regulator of sirC expression with transglutaminase-like and TPR domain